jgi:hypothetical protein
MKIALVHESLTYWLAGEPEVSERVHSSAANLKFSGSIEIDAQGLIRAVNMRYQDRKNLSSGLSFSTTRKFDTLAEAEEYSALYDTVNPRTGYVDLYGADGGAKARLTQAVVKPPVRTVTGVSVQLDYEVVGSKWLLNLGTAEEPEFGTPEITMGGEVVTMG